MGQVQCNPRADQLCKGRRPTGGYSVLQNEAEECVGAPADQEERDDTQVEAGKQHAAAAAIVA